MTGHVCIFVATCQYPEGLGRCSCMGDRNIPCRNTKRVSSADATVPQRAMHRADSCHAHCTVPQPYGTPITVTVQPAWPHMHPAGSLHAYKAYPAPTTKSGKQVGSCALVTICLCPKHPQSRHLQHVATHGDGSLRQGSRLRTAPYHAGCRLMRTKGCRSGVCPDGDRLFR